MGGSAALFAVHFLFPSILEGRNPSIHLNAVLVSLAISDSYHVVTGIAAVSSFVLISCSQQQ